MSRERLEPSALSPLERQLLIGASSSQSKPKIQSIGASPLLSQLKQFLPKMQQANVELQQKLQECDPAELDIEHIPEEGQQEGSVIQMDLACGLLDLKDDAALAAAQRAIAAGGDITVETYDGGSTSDSDSGSESNSESENESESEGADVGNGAAAGKQTNAAGSSRCKAAGPPVAAAAAAAAAADGDAVMEDAGQPAAVAAAAAKVPDGQQQATEQQQQQQQAAGKQRRKLKPKKPMIVELP